MNRKLLIIFIILLNWFQQSAISQDKHLVDSLETQLKNHNAHKLELHIKSPSLFDSTAANILFALSGTYYGSDPDKAMDYAKQSLALSGQIGFKKGMGNAYNNMGWLTGEKGDYLTALEFHKKALKIRQEMSDKTGIGSSYGGIGTIYDEQGNYPESLKNHFASLKIKEETGDKRGIAGCYNNIGLAYLNQGNNYEALKNLITALKINEEIGNIDWQGINYVNIGLAYYRLGNYPEAFKNYFASLKIAKEIGDKNGIANVYNNIGIIFQSQNNYPEALKNHCEALKIFEEIGDKDGIDESYINIGNSYTQKKKYTDALDYLNKSLSLSREIGSLEYIKETYDGLAKLESAQGNVKQAFEYFKLYIATRDSLMNNENSKKIAQIQIQYDTEKKEQQIALLNKDKALRQTQIEKQKTTRNSFMGGIILVLMITGVTYNRYCAKQTANKEISKTLTQLKDTQEQLIEQEKLAALGKITSQTAQEIEVPLNYVNSFAALNNELFNKINVELNDETRNNMLDKLKINLQKINQYGKNGDAVVKKVLMTARNI
jgi:tetratricopeptide (TPR) repeat protein